MRKGINVKNEIINGVANAEVSAEISNDDVSLITSDWEVIANFGEALTNLTGLFKYPWQTQHTSRSSASRGAEGVITLLVLHTATEWHYIIVPAQARYKAWEGLWISAVNGVIDCPS